MSKPWFKTKQYGLGFTPCAWQGWAATAVFVLTLIADVRLLPRQFADPRVGVLISWSGAALLITAFLILCARTTDGDLRWRWGED